MGNYDVDSKHFSLQFAEVAAGTAEEVYAAFPYDGTWVLKGARLTSWTARTAHDTNYTTLTVVIGATNSASQALTITGGSGDLTAGQIINMPVAETEISLGDSMAFTKADSGSGLAFDGRVDLLFERVS